MSAAFEGFGHAKSYQRLHSGTFYSAQCNDGIEGHRHFSRLIKPSRVVGSIRLALKGIELVRQGFVFGCSEVSFSVEDFPLMQCRRIRLA